MLSPPINMPGPAVQDPAGKVLHPAPEVDAEPEPKKLCAPPSYPGCKAQDSCDIYYCNYCDKESDHITPECPYDPDNVYDSDEDDIDPRVGEYQGEREGYSWNCLLGCGGLADCSFDHGKTGGLYGKTKGFYVLKDCITCGKEGHWCDECSIKPRFFTFTEEAQLGAST
ncbi:PREDICTED: uncharacterized protein LOC101299819 isoform X1 [Fragaria vesca subsp. vesca]|uniref:uncharacterized protein LOC101299819 isoform X1 n=1 Tax=Fragaria vesca subsp. vesca TaxID=101020 RepID=UPI0002C3151A|nr:PREDICTED: uncharacterized protein LOC101299819 isoform X1 [Fragaria vesca subsp. vesca]